MFTGYNSENPEKMRIVCFERNIMSVQYYVSRTHERFIPWREDPAISSSLEQRMETEAGHLHRLVFSDQ